MRHFFGLVFIAALMVSPALMPKAHAADAKKDKKEGGNFAEGKVSVEKVDSDKYTSIKIKTPKGDVYNVTIDDAGKDVAQKYEGISVYVSGKVETKKGEKWITVTKIGQAKVKKK